MPRGQKKAEPKCDQHEFELKPCFQHMAHIQQLSLSFCSRHQEKRGKKGGEKGKCLQAPLYNTDNSWASPAFILETDKVFLALLRITIDCGGMKCCWNIICVSVLFLSKSRNWYDHHYQEHPQAEIQA